MFRLQAQVSETLHENKTAHRLETIWLSTNGNQPLFDSLDFCVERYMQPLITSSASPTHFIICQYIMTR